MGVLIFRRSRVGWFDLLMAVGCASIAIAAGGPLISRATGGSIMVMVDLSPSTRGATFRDHDALDARIHQLVGHWPYRIQAFGDSNQPLPADRKLPDIAVDQTVFSPPSADAIVLFSDGQFGLPTAAPPTYPVIDPALDHPGDVAVSQLEWSGSTVIATVKVGNGIGGSARSLHWTGATPVTAMNTTQYATPTGSGAIAAALSSGDLWPENDSLSIRPPPSPHAQRWWIGDSAPYGWRQLNAADLPADPADYLSVAVIVVQNIPSDALSSLGQQRIAQYVRDLGGSVVIAGGDHAFAAGQYDSTALDSISPLASSPPDPTTHWMILIDGSGSMGTAESSAELSPWQIESQTISALLPQLPPSDAVSVGGFARDLDWWSTGKSAKDTATLRLPPVSAYPHGPTNLSSAFEQIISSDDGSTTTQLLVLTDADTELPDPPSLGAAMVQKKIRLYVLALGQGKALPALRSICNATGGAVIEQLDPHQWVSSSKQLLKMALPSRYEHQLMRVQFDNGLSATATEWNRTWLKSRALQLAKSAESPMAATWLQGLGKVTSIAYPAAQAIIENLATQIQSDPNDPRFTVSYQNAGSLTVTVEAVDQQQFLNGEKIQLKLQDVEGGEQLQQSVPQVAPGRYELSIASPRRPMIATILDAVRMVTRFALAGRYPKEFNAIGNNKANLLELARRTGGEIVPASSTRQIDFNWPKRQISMQPEFAIAGFVCIAGWMIQKRRS